MKKEASKLIIILLAFPNRARYIRSKIGFQLLNFVTHNMGERPGVIRRQKRSSLGSDIVVTRRVAISGDGILRKNTDNPLSITPPA